MLLKTILGVLHRLINISSQNSNHLRVDVQILLVSYLPQFSPRRVEVSRIEVCRTGEFKPRFTQSTDCRLHSDCCVGDIVVISTSNTVVIMVVGSNQHSIRKYFHKIGLQFR